MCGKSVVGISRCKLSSKGLNVDVHVCLGAWVMFDDGVIYTYAGTLGY